MNPTVFHADTLKMPTDKQQAASLVRTALRCLEAGRIDSATWRLADALYLLRGAGKALPGIHEPTGRGAKLAMLTKGGAHA